MTFNFVPLCLPPLPSTWSFDDEEASNCIGWRASTNSESSQSLNSPAQWIITWYKPMRRRELHLDQCSLCSPVFFSPQPNIQPPLDCRRACDIASSILNRPQDRCLVRSFVAVLFWAGVSFPFNRWIFGVFWGLIDAVKSASYSPLSFSPTTMCGSLYAPAVASAEFSPALQVVPTRRIRGHSPWTEVATSSSGVLLLSLLSACLGMLFSRSLCTTYEAGNALVSHRWMVS